MKLNTLLLGAILALITLVAQAGGVADVTTPVVLELQPAQPHAIRLVPRPSGRTGKLGLESENSDSRLALESSSPVEQRDQLESAAREHEGYSVALKSTYRPAREPIRQTSTYTRTPSPLEVSDAVAWVVLLLLVVVALVGCRLVLNEPNRK